MELYKARDCKQLLCMCGEFYSEKKDNFVKMTDKSKIVTKVTFLAEGIR